MNVKNKLMLNIDDLQKYGPINIVVFGDSVTHGSVSGDEINYETVYWNRLKQMLNSVRNYIPVNMINAAIGGTTAVASVKRIERDVLSHHPDLVIVCFGLNDVNEPLEDFLKALKEIFGRCKEKTDVIFMTPNMMNTYVAEGTEEIYLDYAAVTAEMQNSGKVDKYMNAAIELAKSMDVTVCDCYAEWKKLYNSGTDTTMLLANRINHPIREMHKLFADKLFDIIIGDDKIHKASDSTMYKK